MERHLSARDQSVAAADDHGDSAAAQQADRDVGSLPRFDAPVRLANEAARGILGRNVEAAGADERQEEMSLLVGHDFDVVQGGRVEGDDYVFPGWSPVRSQHRALHDARGHQLQPDVGGRARLRNVARCGHHGRTEAVRRLHGEWAHEDVLERERAAGHIVVDHARQRHRREPDPDRLAFRQLDGLVADLHVAQTVEIIRRLQCANPDLQLRQPHPRAERRSRGRWPLSAGPGSCRGA